MTNDYVGAGILNIITESLYDNPIVVFREYVQNSMDSILKEASQDNSEIKIWHTDSNLFFLDNGQGIEVSQFVSEMQKIGASEKKKHKNLGYKGIGRLSGVPYCKKLSFINISNYAENIMQMYTINGAKYEAIKNATQDSGLSFSELMQQIGEYSDQIDLSQNVLIADALGKYSDIVSKTNHGFLVILQEISSVLMNTITAKDFFTNLQWLLPVDFDKDLYGSDAKELFYDLTSTNGNREVQIKSCRIAYDDCSIYRPIKQGMLRDYVCKSNFKYAVGFHSFRKDKIAIEKGNSFTGIRIYIDNMLLCDENELLQSLENYGLLSHTLNGQIQSVRGIGAMIYITDKVNISANARRTFIEVTDDDSIEFLKLLAEFVNIIYDTRYSLSYYASAKAKQDDDKQKLAALKADAVNNLRKLAKENIELPNDDSEKSFDTLDETEKKQIIKKHISAQLNQKLKDYLKQAKEYSLENAFTNFAHWLQGNS